LDTDTTLSEAERTDLGKRIKNLKKESANNHFESVRTTAKEFNVIEKINQDNIKKGLKDGLSKEARQIGEWANKVARGEMDPGEYKSRVEEAFGSEENALRIVARGFRDTNL
jgi:chorismate mutase